MDFSAEINPVTAGVILTRRCNLHCEYCAIPDRKSDDMPTEKWLEAINIMEALGIKKLNFIGGETTLYKGIRDVVSGALSSKIGHCSLITNGIKGFDVVCDLINMGLKNISFSLDSMDMATSISPIKARAGLDLVDALEESGLLKKVNLTAYCVMNRKNLHNIPQLVEFLSNKGIQTYFLPYHWHKGTGFEHRKQDYGLSLSNDGNLKKLLTDLADMKDKGFPIANSVAFFSAICKHIEKLDWKCSYLSELRIDADGRLMCCCDKRGRVNENFSIFDLVDKKKLSLFLEERTKDAQNCSGCLWPSSFEAELLNKRKLGC